MVIQRRELLLQLGAVAAFTLIGAGAGRAAEPSVPAAIRPLVVALGAPLDPSDAGLIVAGAANTFENAGLRVDLRALTCDADVIAAVAGLRAGVGLVKAESFLEARAGGIPIVAFAAGLIESPATFYALSASGIHSPFDLVGKRVAYEFGGESAIVYEAMLARLAIPRSRLTEIPFPPSAKALVDGVVDLAPLEEADAIALGRLGARYLTSFRLNTAFTNLEPSSSPTKRQSAPSGMFSSASSRR